MWCVEACGELTAAICSSRLLIGLPDMGKSLQQSRQHVHALLEGSGIIYSHARTHAPVNDLAQASEGQVPFSA